MTLDAPSEHSVAPETSPQPRLWASAERSSQPLTRAPAGPPSTPTTHAPTTHAAATHAAAMHAAATHAAATHDAATHATAPTSIGDPDAAYRDLLTRVREEREQLGQLISHPF